MLRVRLRVGASIRPADPEDDVSAGRSAGGEARLWTRGFATILVAQMGFGYASAAFLLVPKYIVGDHGASALEVGWVAASFGVAAVVFLFVTGELADRGGRRRFFSLGAALMTLASLGFAAVDGVGPLLYVLRFLQGIAFALTFVAGSTLTVDQAPPERLGQAIGLFGLSMLSMNAVGPVVTERLAASHGWPLAFWVASAGSALCLVLSFAVRDRRQPPPPDVEVPGLLAVARRPDQVRIAVVVGAVGATFGAVFNFHQPFALELGMEQVQGFFVAYAAAGIVCRLGFGNWIDRLGRRRVAGWTLAVYATAVGGMTQLGPGNLAIFGAAFGVAHGLWYPAYNAIAVDGVGEHERAKVMALFLGWFNVGFTAGAVPFGWIAGAYGYPAVFAAASALTGAALVLFLLSPEGRSS